MPRGRKPYTKNMPKVKAILDKRQTKDIFQDTKITKARKGRKPLPKRALYVTDDLYITYDSRNWMIVQVNNKKDKEGNYYPDKPFLYCTNLDYAIKILCDYKIQITQEIQDLQKELHKLYNLIDQRIPQNIKPRDLFVELQKDTEEEDI